MDTSLAYPGILDSSLPTLHIHHFLTLAYITSVTLDKLLPTLDKLLATLDKLLATLDTSLPTLKMPSCLSLCIVQIQLHGDPGCIPVHSDLHRVFLDSSHIRESGAIISQKWYVVYNQYAVQLGCLPGSTVEGQTLDTTWAPGGQSNFWYDELFSSSDRQSDELSESCCWAESFRFAVHGGFPSDDNEGSEERRLFRSAADSSWCTLPPLLSGWSSRGTHSFTDRRLNRPHCWKRDNNDVYRQTTIRDKQTRSLAYAKFDPTEMKYGNVDARQSSDMSRYHRLTAKWFLIDIAVERTNLSIKSLNSCATVVVRSRIHRRSIHFLDVSVKVTKLSKIVGEHWTVARQSSGGHENIVLLSPDVSVKEQHFENCRWTVAQQSSNGHAIIAWFSNEFLSRAKILCRSSMFSILLPYKFYANNSRDLRASKFHLNYLFNPCKPI